MGSDAEPARRSTRLGERDPETAPTVVEHPFQLDAEAVVADLIGRLRSCSAPAEFDDLQRALFQHLHSVEGRQAEVSRFARRQRNGKSTPTGDWPLELNVLDRICRQLRSVGDALAWRSFEFDRRPLVALSGNQQSGPMFGKAGLEHELRAAVSSMKDRGTFTLLHDLTSTLRIGDATEFTADGPRIKEIKASAGGGAGKRSRAQVRRMKAAVASVERGAPIPGSEGRFATTEVPLRTHSSALLPLLRRARKERVVIQALDEQFVVSILCADSPDLGFTTENEIAHHTNELTISAYREAGLEGVEHLVQVDSVDRRDTPAAIAPYSIFPFDPDTCAALITDRIVVIATLGWDRLSAAFERLGWSTRCPLPRAAGLLPKDVLHASKGPHSLTLHSRSMTQALVELHEIDNFAAGVVDSTQAMTGGGGLTVFSQEDSVWR